MTAVTITLQAPQAVTTTLMLGSKALAPATPTTVTTTTLAALRAGSTAIKYVVEIEGYPFLLTDATVAAALAAHAGTDWTQGVGGLFVDLDNQQKMHPWEPFNGGGQCVLRVQADATDQFGIDTHRKSAGPEAQLIAPLNRGGSQPGQIRKIDPSFANSSSLPFATIDANTGFVAGDTWIGTECIEIASADQNRLWIRQRGKYGPEGAGGSVYFGTGYGVVGAGQIRPAGGGDSLHFAQHHRVAADSQGVLLNPTVSQQPRVWIGKRVAVYMHVVDGNGNLNSRANAQKVFAGRIAQIADDPNTGYTVVELKNVLDEVKDATMGRDQYTATMVEGINLATGRTFGWVEENQAQNTGVYSISTANTLTVVASGAAGSNQINAGYYGLEDIFNFINNWLSGEFAAGRIFGQYKWGMDATSAGAPVKFAAKCTFTMNAASSTGGYWRFDCPAELVQMLGLVDPSVHPSTTFGGNLVVYDWGTMGQSKTRWGTTTPQRGAAFRVNATPSLPGFGIAFQFNVQDERGTPFDQFALLPSAVKLPQNYGLSWGVFLVDNKFLVMGTWSISGTTTTFTCAPFNLRVPGLAGIPVGQTIETYGHTADDPTPITVKQVYFLEGSFATIFKTLLYNTGTPGYNHSAFDTLGYGIGLGLPWTLLGPTFERTVDRLPGATAPMCLVIDKPATLKDLLGPDLILRRAFLVYRNGHLELAQWQTPTTDLATVTLSESNKAEPSEHKVEQRSASVLSDQWERNVVKIQYQRDLSIGDGGVYQKSITFEDHTSVDDGGCDPKPFEIKARNTYAQTNNAGSGIEALAPGFLAMMPLFSKPVRTITRSIDLTNYEGVAPGDVAVVSDAFARDPATGQRGIATRPALITRVRYNPGGAMPGDPGKRTNMSGEVELFFLDLHRWTSYAPGAQLDDTASSNGFSSGYNDTSWIVQAYPHAYSETSEAIDASRFNVGDAIRVIEMDPASVTAPLTWRATITAINGNQISLSQPLRNPAFNASLRYRVVSDTYNAATDAQHARAYEAAFATGKIANRAPAWQLSSTSEPLTYTPNGFWADPAEFVPTMAYGDGAPHDIGHERALIRTLTALEDYKTAHMMPAIRGDQFVNGDPGDIFFSGNTAAFVIAAFMPVWFGFEQLSGTINRTLTVQPIYSMSAAGQVRVTVSKGPPQDAPGLSYASLQTVSFGDTTSSYTWVETGAVAKKVASAQPLTIVKDTDGTAWITVEVQAGGAQGVKFYGFAQLSESGRVGA